MENQIPKRKRKRIPLSPELKAISRERLEEKRKQELAWKEIKVLSVA